MLQAEVRDIDWPLPEQLLPPTDVILDLLVFCAGAVGQPIKESYHHTSDTIIPVGTAKRAWSGF